MPKIFKLSEQNFTTRGAELPQFDMLSGARISKMAGAERMVFDFRKLPPGKYSFPYHFHHNAEELFYIVSGKCSLRTPEGVTEVGAGDLIHFEVGPGSAHQMFNHTDEPCVYLDIRTFDRVDVAEYPDSNKMTAMPPGKFFKQDSAVSYLTGEENVEEIWKNLKSTINAE
jgi:uncharacterized cupin superfamily protein